MLGIYKFDVCINVKYFYYGVYYNIVDKEICCSRGVNEKYIYFVVFVFYLFMIEEFFVQFVSEVCVFSIQDGVL